MSEYDIKDQKVIEECKAMAPPKGYLVLPWADVPETLRSVFNQNGGDEDFAVFTRVRNAWASWLDRVDVGNDPDVYSVGDITVFVGSHG